MNAMRRHRLLFARFVAGVLVLAALGPAVARGLAFAQGQIAPWSVICSASPFGRTAGTDEDRTAHLLDQCALCVLAAHSPALPTADAPVAPPPPVVQVDTVSAAHADAPAHSVWAAARSRAPPAAC